MLILLQEPTWRGRSTHSTIHVRSCRKTRFKLGQDPVLSLAVGHGLHLETVFDEALDCLVEAFRQLARNRSRAWENHVPDREHGT